MPFFFGVGFIAPLIAQILERFSLPVPLGMSALAFGLLIGAPWGLITVLRGRWL